MGEIKMDFYDVIHARRSRRGYLPDPISDETLKKIADAVVHAPTACNFQPYKVLVIRKAELLAEICKIYERPWLAEAP